ncbi:MAG: NAD(P)/FAD-dependent oxidoreductase [Paludibacteraceae bacterium]|nr:NAD(P)/FAD-dependent oxidoreductase [Paludibacteraceae bacterium]
MNKRTVVIGAGLGGLQCAYALAKNGMEVIVLEQDSHIGGCLQSFRRGTTLFDTGLHYIGGLREGESLHPLFRYFNLLDLPWQQLDEACFDEIVIGENSYAFATGHERFVEALSAAFPNERQGLCDYAQFLKNVGEHIFDSFLPREASGFYGSSLFARSAHEFLEETIHDPLLRKVLSGTSIKMELNRDTLPLYVFAQINNSFIQSAWRLRGGGQQIADHLAENIRSMGGMVRTSAGVSAIEEKDGRTIGVRLQNDEFVEADYVVADIHPHEVLRLMANCPSVRNVYRRRMQSLDDTIGMFTANIRLKPDAMPYENRNIFVHREDADLWNIDTQHVNSVMVSFYSDQPAIDLLTPMRWSDVSQWADKPVGRRGEDYVAYKNEKVEQCLQLVEKRLPCLRDAIDHVYTSSPLTYYRYTRTHDGSSFGIRKDWHSPMTTVLTPRTPIQNVFLTGQNLNLHGILGVSMTSVFTCAEILGMDQMREELKIK